MQISVIIPHYNCVERLIELLKSIPEERDIEIIVVDDNSTCDISVITQYIESSNKNIKFIFNTSGKKGAGASRNCGMNIATGKWLLFADSDDYFVEGWYDCVSKYLAEEADMIYFAPTSYNYSTGKACSRHLLYKELVDKMAKKPSHVNELNLKYCFCTPWSKLIRREIPIENDLVFDEIVASNDIMFITQCAYYSKKILADTDVIYCVTRDGKSMTAEKDLNKFMTRVDVLRRRYLFLEKNLGKKDFARIHMNRYAMGKLVDVFIEHWGMKVFFDILKIYKCNKIRIFDVGMLNPIEVFHKLRLELLWWRDIQKNR